MTNDPNRWGYADPRTASRYDMDAGLRQHMLSVYNYMGGGLLVTGLVAVLAYASGFYQSIMGTPLIWLVVFAPFAMVMVMSFGVQRMSVAALQLSFWAYAALMGLSLSVIFLVYTKTSIASVFFISATMFLGMSLWGYTTRTDLSRMGAFMLMGLFGIIIASVVNLFLHSSGLQFAVSIIGVVIFTGLTAYDTQKIKEIYLSNVGAEWAGKSAIMGALNLYLDFINIFLFMLRLMGDRRN